MNAASKEYRRLQEQIIRETKFRTLQRHRYRPNYYVNPVTSKFYSRHECSKTLDDVETDPRILQYFKNVELARAKGPKDKYPEPVTESQEIGWFEESEQNKNARFDKRFYHPLVTSSFTKLMNLIKYSQKS